jgi:hypothetical protein
MRISIFVSPDEVLHKLNLPPPTADAEVAFIRALENTSAQGIGNEWRPYLSAELGARFRGLVDEWLATGRRMDGSERPRSRNLSQTSAACFKVMSYMDRYPARVALSPDGSELSVDIAEVSTLPLPGPNPYYDNGEEAIRLFVGVITSDWRWQLCKCVYCGKYFLHARTRQVYSKGTFCCRQHQSHAAAVSGTKARRMAAKSALIELAAGRLLKAKETGTDWMRNPKTTARLASQISRHIQIAGNPTLKASTPVIKSNWVTRNRHAIERKRIELASRSH